MKAKGQQALLLAAQGSERMLFFGESALADGFALIGFETWRDPDIQILEKELCKLVNSRSKALIFVDQELAKTDSNIVRTVKHESGNILMIEVPPLASPESFVIDLDQCVGNLVGCDMSQDDEV